jgi:hypothetical protein
MLELVQLRPNHPSNGSVPREVVLGRRLNQDIGPELHVCSFLFSFVQATTTNITRRFGLELRHRISSRHNVCCFYRTFLCMHAF